MAVVARAEAILRQDLFRKSYPQPPIVLTGARGIGARPFVESDAFSKD